MVRGLAQNNGGFIEKTSAVEKNPLLRFSTTRQESDRRKPSGILGITEDESRMLPVAEVDCLEQEEQPATENERDSGVIFGFLMIPLVVWGGLLYTVHLCIYLRYHGWNIVSTMFIVFQNKGEC